MGRTAELLVLLGCVGLSESFLAGPATSLLRGHAPHRLARPQVGWRAMGRVVMYSDHDKGKAVRKSPVVQQPRNIRNVALVGHSHAGKTALTEWMLFDEKVITKKPVNGASSLDSDPVESARHSSVFSHYARVPHRDSLIEVADTPWGDFPADASASLDGADSAVLVISAADGVQSGAVHAYEHCREAGIKTIVALSKMDRPFLKVDEVLSDIESTLGVKPIPLQVPKGASEDFKSVDPLLVFDAAGNLKKNEQDGLEQAWAEMEEAVALTDDDLLVDYLENSHLTTDQVIKGLRSGVLNGKILPLVYTSAERNLGVLELMDVIVGVMPDPVELRQQALQAAGKNGNGQEPGVEGGFAARVVHTSVDSFGSLSVLRVISNSQASDGSFSSLPQEGVIVRTGQKFKLPSATTTVGLQGKERLPLEDPNHVVPGDVIAVPKLPESVHTNDIITVPDALEKEKSEISLEQDNHVLTPLSRPAEDVPLMASATVSLQETGKGKKSSKGKSSAGDDKLGVALEAMAREDLALRVERDQGSGLLLLRGMSTEHLQLVATRLSHRYGLEVELGAPPVQYRETLSKKVHNIEGKHKKQTGGSGQFGICYISMEPIEEGQGVEFISQIKGGAIPKPFVASVEKGVREQLQSGGPLGYPVTDVRVTLTDGKTHSTDSKDIAFQMAGKNAVKAALEKGKSSLLQPMERVLFMVEDSLQGDVNSIVSRQDGYVTSSNPNEEGPGLVIEATIPTSAISEVSTNLRVASAGEGQFTSEFSHYQPVPENKVEQLLEE